VLAGRQHPPTHASRHDSSPSLLWSSVGVSAISTAFVSSSLVIMPVTRQRHGNGMEPSLDSRMFPAPPLPHGLGRSTSLFPRTSNTIFVKMILRDNVCNLSLKSSRPSLVNHVKVQHRKERQDEAIRKTLVDMGSLHGRLSPVSRSNNCSHSFDPQRLRGLWCVLRRSRQGQCQIARIQTVGQAFVHVCRGKLANSQISTLFHLPDDRSPTS
jgi:hypothetical protein